MGCRTEREGAANRGGTLSWDPMKKTISKLSLCISAIVPLFLSAGAWAADEAEITVVGSVTTTPCYVSNVTRAGGVSWTLDAGSGAMGLGQTVKGTLELAGLTLDALNAAALVGPMAAVTLQFAGTGCTTAQKTTIRPMNSGTLGASNIAASDLVPQVGTNPYASGYGIGVVALNTGSTAADFTSAKPGLQALTASLQSVYGFQLASPLLANLSAGGVARTAGKVQTAFQVDVE